MFSEAHPETSSVGAKMCLRATLWTVKAHLRCCKPAKTCLLIIYCGRAALCALRSERGPVYLGIRKTVAECSENQAKC
jgi:hypothetical protein